MNQTLINLIKELGTKKQVKVEYLLPILKKIKREIEPKKPKLIDSFGNPIKAGDVLSCSEYGKEHCIVHIKEKSPASTIKFSGHVAEYGYFSEGLIWKYALSVKAYKANPSKYNKLLKGK